MMEQTQCVPDWFARRDLPAHVSLQLLDASGNVVFASNGKWLHPLLEVERFLEESSLDSGKLFLHDRISGRAAACLTVRMGFTRVKASVMSRLAEQVYRAHGVCCLAQTLVDRIACKTEELIDSSMDLDAVHAMIVGRASQARETRN